MECQFDSRHEKLHRLNRRISLMLHWGIAASLVLIVCGLILFLVSGAAHTSPMLPLPSLINGFITLDPSAFITLGVIFILLLPAIMLILSLVYFFAVKEKQPVIVCIVLLLMLACSLILVLK
ncbi:MAG: DUF1634 domain-containing protein [Dehalococcoidia bacterium]